MHLFGPLFSCTVPNMILETSLNIWSRTHWQNRLDLILLSFHCIDFTDSSYFMVMSLLKYSTFCELDCICYIFSISFKRFTVFSKTSKFFFFIRMSLFSALTLYLITVSLQTSSILSEAFPSCSFFQTVSFAIWYLVNNFCIFHSCIFMCFSLCCISFL